MKKTFIFIFICFAAQVLGQNCATTTTICEGSTFEVCKNGYTQTDADGNDHALILLLTAAGSNAVIQSSGDVANDGQACFTFNAPPVGSYEVHALNYNTMAIPNALPVSVGDDISAAGAVSPGCYNSNFLTDFVCYEVVPLPVASATCTAGLANEAVIEVDLMSGTNPTDVMYSLNGGAAQSAGQFVITTTGMYNILVTNTVTGCTFEVEVSCMQLPLELTRFEGTCTDGTRLISWSTSSETDVAHFIVERSGNGIDYQPIGEVPAAGYSTTLQNYAFKDETAGLRRYYYRLHIVETTGVRELSRVVSVECLNGGFGVLDIYPNPTNDEVMLTYETVDRNPLTFKLMDTFGRTLWEEKLTPDIGLHNKTLDLSSYSPAVYFILIDNGKQRTANMVIRD